MCLNVLDSLKPYMYPDLGLNWPVHGLSEDLCGTWNAEGVGKNFRVHAESCRWLQTARVKGNVSPHTGHRVGHLCTFYCLFQQDKKTYLSLDSDWMSSELIACSWARCTIWEWGLNLLSLSNSALNLSPWRGVTHQTRLVQWTWNVLSIQDYPGVSDECNPHSSHPSHENQPSLWRRIHEDGLSWCEKWVRHIVAIHRTRRLSWRE